MPRLFAGTGSLNCDALRIQDRQHLKRKTLTIEPLSDAAAIRLVKGLFERIAVNSPDRPRSPSSELWRCTREMEIGLKNQNLEKMLEKSVAILADQQHMRGWFNQCPVATGIADPSADGGCRVDLVHLSGRAVRLVELKWKSHTPVYALFEVLEYGLAYLLARLRRRDFGLDTQPLMLDRVDQVRLEVVGPQAFFHNGVQLEFFAPIDKALASFAAAQSDGALSMSLHALSFPAWFDRVPFASGQEVKEKCANPALTDEGRSIRDAFDQLVPAASVPRERFLKDVPGTDIERILDAAAGNEIQSGKFDKPESSAALAVNAFGFFLHRPADLPLLPGLEHAGWPARSLSLERAVRYPWGGGSHPVPDCLVATTSTLIGIECKRSWKLKFDHVPKRDRSETSPPPHARRTAHSHSAPAS